MYRRYESDLFKKQKRRIPRSEWERIEKVVSRILKNPELTDGVLKGDRAGKHKKYVGRTGWRVVYYWCERCVQENNQELIGCENCDEIPKDALILFEVFRRGRGY